MINTLSPKTLTFEPVRIADLPRVAHYLHATDSRTCDYTIGGIFLWARYFDYQLCESNNSLYIRGGREDCLSIPAFSLPLGEDAINPAAIDRLAVAVSPLWFSAIPEDRLHIFAETAPCQVMELGSEWSDYLYDIHALATLSGKALGRKRNHLNRFRADHPNYRLAPIDVPAARALLERHGHDGSPLGIAEFEAVDHMLTHWEEFAPYMHGMCLWADDHTLAAFTIGEVKGDTLHVHVEKADHSISGSGEAICSLFAARMLEEHPELQYVNRQDNAGDPGLQASKESWHPLRLLPKYNVLIL